MWNIFNPLIIVLAKFQRQGIAHRSIKPENILRGYDNEIKISGFGCSTALMEHFATDTDGFPDRDLKNL
jgi:serine/threonine protein kinase